jgi:LPS-assembly protein
VAAPAPRLQGLVMALAQAGLLGAGMGWAPTQAAQAAELSAPPQVPADVVAAVSTSGDAPTTRPSSGLKQNRGQQPLFFEADQLEGEAGQSTRATGRARVVQGDLQIRANELSHDAATNTAKATGDVRVRNGGNLFVGPSLSLQLDTETGEFASPRFWFSRTRAGGSAQRVEFLGDNRLQAYWTSYSSCTPANTADGLPGEPDWALKTSKVYLDMGKAEGRAEDAVIWFQGVPILAAPALTFPLDDRRKSGWLPPSFDYDSKSGFEFSEPYYWNIAPNLDSTLTPLLSTRRGVGLDAEVRYLQSHDQGTWHVVALPDDRVAMRSRGLADLAHTGAVEGAGASNSRTDYDLRWRRVSDDDYWKDFSHNLPTLTPRLYDSHMTLKHALNARNWGLGDSQTEAYANVQTWQTLKDLDPASDPKLSQITTPYRRTPQLGVRSRNGQDSGLNWSLNGEFNRFTNADTSQVSGNRVQLKGEMSLPYNVNGLRLTPKLALRSTSYDLDQALSNGSKSATRTVPTLSLDGTASFERPVHWFSRDLTQTLEPRVQYVRTAYKDQSNLPLFDTDARDFNQYAIFSENAFTGGDRINDANQVTLGLTSRLLDGGSGAEALRMGVVQKVLLADQRINPDDNEPITQRLSDLLLLGSTSVIPMWTLDGSTQFAAQNHALQRGLLSLRYSPGPWRTVSLNYRYTRGASEQYEFGWQWPLAGRTPQGRGDSANVDSVRQQALNDPLNLSGQRSSGNAGCGGTWYGVGRLSYSARDARLTDALVGMEYDAGCWVGRVVAQRQSVGTATSTRIMFQLELIGLSRISLGSNPLKSLKDNVPGYRLLRDDSKATTTTGESPLLDDE